MRLRLISEAGEIKGSPTVIKDAAESLGDLIQFVYSLGQDNEEFNALNTFLSTPKPRAWERTKWIIDSLMQRAVTLPDPTFKQRAQRWAALKALTPPVVVAALYDVDPKFTKGTPIQNMGLSKQLREKLKIALGPQGYVSALANADEVSPAQLKNLLKTTAKSGKGLQKSSQEDMPGIKPVVRF